MFELRNIGVEEHSQKARVLVADDDALCRRTVATKLVRLQATVTEADDGYAAFELLRRQEFDLAIIDLEMPNMDGYELGRHCSPAQGIIVSDENSCFL